MRSSVIQSSGGYGELGGGVLLCLMVLAGMSWVSAADAAGQAREEPISASLALVPTSAQPGEAVELRLTLTVNAPWHVYGRVPGDGGQEPIALRLKLPEGVRAVGTWIWPEFSAVFDPGQHVLSHTLHVGVLTAPVTVTVALTYQACDDQLCLPVQMLELEATLGVKDAAPAGPPQKSTASTLAQRMQPHCRFPLFRRAPCRSKKS